MAIRRSLKDSELEALLMEREDVDTSEESCSEEENNVEVDDVQSDSQDEPSDSEVRQIHTRGNCPVLTSDRQAGSPSGTSEDLTGHNSSILTLSQNSVCSRSRYVWSTSKGRTSGRAAAMNIVRAARGPARALRGMVDPLTLFEYFMTHQIMEEIVKWTNSEIHIKKQNYALTTSTQKNTSKEEIRALIGVLVLTAALKDNHLTLEELFNTEYSGARYVACMSKERCDFLLRCLRFDDKTLRIQRQKDDPFTPIREIWEMLMTQCRNNYVPGTNVTIDEQLLAFRGRCKFRMYIPNKPAKYGIKLEMVCDSGTRYMVNCTPYLGKGTDTRGVPLGEYFVKELTRSIHGTNRNVTMDNWFTSVPLAKQLSQKPYKLTLVGTMRANKKEIPEELKNNRSRDVGTTMFCYDGPLTLLSYKPKPAKMVYLLSSCDEEGTVNPETKKPYMIEFYNSTKGGVDTFDQMCSVMSCSRKTNRWPMCVFYGMLNIACINSYIIYCHNASTMGEKVMNRRDFMKKLHSQLVEPWLKIKLQKPTMPTHIKQKIQKILGEGAVQEEVQSQQEDKMTSNNGHEVQTCSSASNMRKRKICGKCSYKKRRMTKTVCSKCKISICGEHKVDFCLTCASKG